MISFHKDLIDIYSYEKIKDENGIVKKGWTIKYSDVRCTLDRKTVTGITNELVTRSEVRYTLFIPKEIEIVAGMKIVVKTRNDLTFRSQTPFEYGFLGKQEVELETWNE